MLGGNGDNEVTAPKCGRCLISELNIKELSENVRDYISLIPQENRTADEEYLRRLGICKECLWLADGLCGECGCFAEIRAAKAKISCPLGKWADQKN